MTSKDTRIRSKLLKIVLDTNIWISLLLNGRLTESFKQVLENENRFQIFLSDQMVSELAKVLTYPRLVRVLKEAKLDPRVALASVLKRAQLISVSEGTIHEVKEDETDNRILECAVVSRAKFIVSGDIHLLDLKEYKELRIVTAREFLDRTID